eukprot:s7_g67.t1
MPKRQSAAPKADAKPKAKAKTAPRSGSSLKAQSMSEDELGEYRLLHSKLTYRSKCGVAGADEALQQFKSNRMVHSMDYASVNAVAKKSQWLNSFQVMQKLGSSADQLKQDKDAKEILDATLDSLPQKDHYVEALQKKAMKLYEWHEECTEEKIQSSESMSITATGSTGNVPKPKAIAAPPDPNAKGGQTIAINYDAACRTSRAQMNKLIKELEKVPKDNDTLMDDMKKCETKLVGSLQELTSCLCEHPTGGSEDVYNKFKTVLDETLIIKAASEKTEILAKDAINAFNDKMDQELEKEFDKLSEQDQKGNKKKDQPAEDASAQNGNEPSAKPSSGSGDGENANGSAA